MTRASMLTGVGLTALVMTGLIRTAFMKTTLHRNKVFVRLIIPLSRRINHATCNVNVILTFESMDESLWPDGVTSQMKPLHSAILKFSQRNFWICNILYEVLLWESKIGMQDRIFQTNCR